MSWKSGRASGAQPPSGSSLTEPLKTEHLELALAALNPPLLLSREGSLRAQFLAPLLFSLQLLPPWRHANSFHCYPDNSQMYVPLKKQRQVLHQNIAGLTTPKSGWCLNLHLNERRKGWFWVGALGLPPRKIWARKPGSPATFLCVFRSEPL